jgi:hypothetical protein
MLTTTDQERTEMSRSSTRQSVSEFLRNHYVDPTPIARKQPAQIRTTNQMVREFERVCGPQPTSHAIGCICVKCDPEGEYT